MKLKIVWFSILGILVGLVCLLVYIAKPHRSGDIHLTYGHGSARVFYEDNGVPHIYADNKEVAAFTLGYLNAADRLWQYEYIRRLSQGRLSEVFGEATLKLDESMRLLGLKQSCNLTKEYFSSEEIFNYYDSYVKGINEYVERNLLPFYFQIFFLKFDKWTLTDTCTCLKFFHFSLNHNWGFEISRDYIEAFSQDQNLIDMLFPYQPETFDEITTHVITEHEIQMQGRFVDNRNEILANNSRSAKLSTYLTNQVKAIEEDLKEVTRLDGSNSWVISGKHTKSGKPILWNDPHVSNSAPTMWYYSHIEYPDGSFVFGGNMPGIAVHAVTTTDKISIGITNIYVDNSDVYEEIIVDDKYLYNDQYYPLEVRHEVQQILWKSIQISIIFFILFYKNNK